MNKLGFYKEYINPIKEGVKTSTIRKHFDGRIGDEFAVYDADSNILGFTKKQFGFIRIKEIKHVRFDDIDKNIARTEGYLHEDFLKESLHGIYPDLKDSTLLYYIVFEFL